MESTVFLLLLFGIGFFASFLGSFISGGTSLISLVSMIFFGVPPHLAMSTYVTGSFGSRIGGLHVFAKARKVVWTLVLPLSIAALAGSAIGAHVLVSTSEEVLYKVMGVLILLFIPLSLAKKNLGVQRKEVTPMRRRFGIVLYFLIAVLTGFFAAGTGVFFLYLYMLFFGLTILEIKGTDKIPGIFLDLGTAVVLISNSIVNVFYVAAFLPGMFLGATLGAKYAIKLGDKWLRIIVLITVAAMGLSLLFRG